MFIIITRVLESKDLFEMCNKFFNGFKLFLILSPDFLVYSSPVDYPYLMSSN